MSHPSVSTAGIMVTRTWLRDGSRNVMPLKSAVSLLTCSGRLPQAGTPEEVERRLRAGEVIETTLATFKVEP